MSKSTYQREQEQKHKRQESWNTYIDWVLLSVAVIGLIIIL